MADTNLGAESALANPHEAILGHTPVRVLTIPVKGIYFDQIKCGEKLHEYRLRNAYWAKRLRGREYDRIVLTRGYPKGGGVEGVTRLTREWRSFTVGTITHEHFGPDAVEIYAIDVSAPAQAKGHPHDR